VSTVARISCSRRVNSCFFMTSSSKTNRNVARTAKVREPDWRDRNRRGHRAGILSRRWKPERIVRSAEKKLRFRFVRHKGVRYFAVSVFSKGDNRRPRSFSSPRWQGYQHWLLEGSDVAWSSEASALAQLLTPHPCAEVVYRRGAQAVPLLGAISQPCPRA
jgi:hypothetical protein